jgi:hypothetical protein
MSNYINVLRRLERERRVPDSAPLPVAPAPIVPAPVVQAPVVPTPVVAPPEAPAVEPVVARTPLTPARPAAPAVVTPTAPPPVAPTELRETAPAARTVIPLPTAPPPPVEAPAAPIAPAAVEPPVARVPPDTRRERAFATEAHPGIAALLESIRLIANGRDRRVVVFCGASTAEAVNTLAQDLAQHADRSGMRSFVGSLFRSAAGTIVAAAHDPATTAQAVDLDAGLTPEGFATWLDRVAPASDLVIVTGPPLATSIDAALLACACDGLVIVAESEVTERAALQVAAERARIAGCKTLGVVMHGTKDRMPGWLRRMLGDRSERHA